MCGGEGRWEGGWEAGGSRVQRLGLLSGGLLVGFLGVHGKDLPSLRSVHHGSSRARI